MEETNNVIELWKQYKKITIFKKKEYVDQFFNCYKKIKIDSKVYLRSKMWLLLYVLIIIVEYP